MMQAIKTRALSRGKLNFAAGAIMLSMLVGCSMMTTNKGLLVLLPFRHDSSQVVGGP